jgi:alkylhydroperoxidase/carboxymuconolactone decarboxylase family protein YurZ
MGCKLSSSRSDSTSSGTTGQCTAELSSYLAQCRSDPQIQTFDANLQLRTTRVVSSMTSFAGPMRSLSFNSLLEVTGGLLDLNREVVTVLLEVKRDIWNCPDLFQLVEEYFDTSIESLDFCNCLENCLKRARDSQISIQLALHKFEAESSDQEINFPSTLQELERFKQMGEPFTPEFFQVLESVRIRHLNMLEKMLKRKNKLDNKLKSIKSWKKISSLIFVAAVVAVVLCSIVAASVSAPPLLTALATAAVAVPVGSIGTWINSLFKGYENAINGERGVLSTMQVGTFIAISDLDSIRALTENLEIQIRSMLDNTDFVLRDNEAVRFGMEEIKKKMGAFMKSVEQLGEQNDHYRRDIRMARTVVLRKIINYQSKAV